MRFTDSDVAIAEIKELGEPLSGEYHVLVSRKDREQLGKEMLRFVEKVHDEHPDVLIFLDKSARPAAWFFSALWNEMYPDEPKPEIKFVNLGQEKGIGPETTKGFFLPFFAREATLQQKEAVKEQLKSSKLIPLLRQNFQIGRSQEKTYLDNKMVWIINEHSYSGNTVFLAETLFEEAFKGRYRSLEVHTIFSTEAPWGINRSGLIGVADRKKTSLRAVPIYPPTEESRELRHEINSLAQEIGQKAKNEKLNRKEK